MRSLWKHVLALTLLSVLVAPALARPPINEVLAKGSEWLLNVDGESGVLRVVGGQASPGQGGGWSVTLDVSWDGRPGTLEGRSFTGEKVQAVTLNLSAPDGTKFTARGYIARESSNFMAGFSTYRTGARDVNGAWYALRQDTGAAPATDATPAAAAGTDAAGAMPAAPGAEAGAPADTASPADQQAAVRLCRVVGTITGKLNLVGRVAAYAGDSDQQAAIIRPHSDGSFELEPLPDGRYRIAPVPAGPFELVVAPQLRRVDCEGPQEHRVEFQVLGTVGGR